MSNERCRAALTVAAVIAATTTASRASAYCRTSVCNGDTTSQVCTPPQATDCGTPLFWSSDCIGFSIQQDASTQVSLADATRIFEGAFANWTSAKCSGGGSPHMRVQNLGPVACHKVEYNENGPNANIIQFDDDDWPYMGAADTIALTTVTYDDATGEIFDADMELNSHGVTFTIGDTAVAYDLPSIAQHETGHFLGLAHSADPEATMFASYSKGDTSLRTLDADDVTAICVVYPPGPPIADDCDATPRHGFSGECGGVTTGGCCSVAPGSSGEGFAGLAASAAMLLVSRARRRSRATR